MPRFTLSLFVFFAVFISLYDVHAGGVGISPKRLVISAGERFVDVQLVNSSAVRQQYEITLVNKRMDALGGLVDADAPADGEFFADKLIRYTPRRVDIAPGASQTVRVLSRLSSASADGEYRSHMLFRQIASADMDASSTLYAVSIPVILRKGDLVSSFHLANPEVIFEGGVHYVAFDIHRAGSQSLLGNVEVYVGSDVVARLNGVATYLSTPKRRVIVPLPAGHSVDDISGQGRIVFSTPDGRVELSF